MSKLDELLDKIVQKHLGIQTLETQDSDQLDFHEVSVWALRESLIEAFSVGVELGFDLNRARYLATSEHSD